MAEPFADTYEALVERDDALVVVGTVDETVVGFDAYLRFTFTTTGTYYIGVSNANNTLYDATTGGCRDGLHRDRPNENCGGESVVSYLLGLAEMRQMAHMTDRRPALPIRAQGA